MFQINHAFDAFRELDAIRNEVSRAFFGDDGPLHRYRLEKPAMNVWRNDDGLIVTADLPGVNVDELDITVEGDTLSIKGQFTDDSADEATETNFHRRERFHGPFGRVLQLPFEVDAEKTEANYENGVLTLTLGRPEALKPKKVLVQAV